jgi:hypothetical protein
MTKKKNEESRTEDTVETEDTEARTASSATPELLQLLNS